MATSTIRIDDGIREETSRIAAQLGLTFNGVVNILLRKFNAVQGFPFEVRIEELREASVFDMTSLDFEKACKEAVANREDFAQAEHVTRLDRETGRIVKKFKDGRVEYVLD